MASPLAAALLGSALAVLLAVVAVRSAVAARRRQQRRRLLAHRPDTTQTVGFFHPYCNAGGGGERVLWTAIACMQREYAATNALFVVYTGDVGPGKASKDQVLAKAEARFGIKIAASTIEFVPLRYRWLVEDSTWPRLTLLGQSLGSVILALEGIFSADGLVPDYWIDTMGYAFTYPLVKYLCRIPVASYTHYPTISTDMLERVRSRRAGHTNSSIVARSRVLSALKLAYYRLFATAYTASLCRADVIWVNSSWTRAHVEKLVNGASALKGAHRTKRLRLLYPPCDTTHLARFPLETRYRTPPIQKSITILSLAQFRPEKEHPTQLRAFAQLLLASSSSSPVQSQSQTELLLSSPHLPVRDKLRLVLAGSVRGPVDADRVEALRRLATELGIAEQVEFVVNESYDVISQLMEKATIGLHTMVDEHFGITLVEFQAAGLITLAHASAGPLNDIIVPSGDCAGSTGFLAPEPSRSQSRSPFPPSASPDAAEDLAKAFAHQLEHILSLPTEKQDELRRNARENAVTKFRTDVFERGWLDGCRDLSTRFVLLRDRESREKEE